ncbi:MAG: CHC2 zinc finger domain-containing protein, partial [Steroidobacteraceae bacterium]
MAGLIPKTFIDDLVGRADIVEIINARVPLKKTGREYRACCPFHSEKTPSFWVNPVKQFYYCFGCGASGTVLSFLMNYDHLPFVEAVEELVGRVGVEVPREQSGVGQAPTVSDDLYAVMGKTAAFYAEQLGTTERAQTYAMKRGLEPATIAQFS